MYYDGKYFFVSRRIAQQMKSSDSFHTYVQTVWKQKMFVIGIGQQLTTLYSYEYNLYSIHTQYIDSINNRPTYCQVM